MKEPRPGDFYPMDPNKVEDEGIDFLQIFEPNRVSMPSKPVRLREFSEILNPNLFDDVILQHLNALKGRTIGLRELSEWGPIFVSMGIRTQIRRYFIKV
jgi:hypothetical protein